MRQRGGLKRNVELQLPGGRNMMVSAGTSDYTDRFVALLQGSR